MMVIDELKHTWSKTLDLKGATSIAPLVVFRIVFGLIMCFSILRFIYNGWVTDLYINPKLFFPYEGFEFIQPLEGNLMYLLFGLLALSFLFIAIGFQYRIATVFAFIAFTYVEMIDKTNYLNHYYLVSIVCLLLIFLPAHRSFSVDSFVKKQEISQVPKWIILLLKLQIAIVYFYAGLAKLNYDWLVLAMPLKLWLPAQGHLPLIGYFFKQEWVAYVFSWGGALYDLSIPFLLFWRRTRPVAYFLVIVFHLLTYILFQIGMFPFIMIGISTLFFSEATHLKIINKLKQFFHYSVKGQRTHVQLSKPLRFIWATFFILQLTLPFRYLIHSGNLYWTEQGYRFSWRVMLMEKAGYCIFEITDPKTNRSWEINNYDYLTETQEKMMSTQSDMIMQFAHHLKGHYEKRGINNPIIKVKSYVTLNGRPAKLYLDPNADLTEFSSNAIPSTLILAAPQS